MDGLVALELAFGNADGRRTGRPRPFRRRLLVQPLPVVELGQRIAQLDAGQRGSESVRDPVHQRQTVRDALGQLIFSVARYRKGVRRGLVGGGSAGRYFRILPAVPVVAKRSCLMLVDLDVAVVQVDERCGRNGFLLAQLRKCGIQAEQHDADLVAGGSRALAVVAHLPHKVDR